MFNGLYRLDAHLRPVPDLATRLPTVSADGRTWTVELRSGVRFHDGSRFGPRDVIAAYRLLLSANCPYGELCDAASGVLEGVTASGERAVAFRVRRPSGPLLSLVLAQLGMAPAVELEASVARFSAGAARLQPGEAAALVDRVTTLTNADACLSATPPAECRIDFFRTDLEDLLRRAAILLPGEAFQRGSDGRPDPEAYAAALLERARRLAAAVAAEGADRAAAAFPLLDIQARPVGTGAYEFASYRPGAEVRLRRNESYFGGRVGPTGVKVAIVADPAVAATALRTGEIDWLPEVTADEAASLEGGPGVRVGRHPAGEVRLIVFNVRPGRLYAEAAARRAFALCLPRTRIVAAATGERAVPALSVTSPGSWAHDAGLSESATDPAAARRMLEAAGWRSGPDGIYVRAGRRLSSAVYIRPTRTEQLEFARQASEHLRGCGIEFVARELGFSADLVLRQVEHPNEFETYLGASTLSLDPDPDFSVFDSARRTTAQNPGDANFGGYASAQADRLIQAGRGNVDPAQRRAAYLELQRLLSRDLPAYPLWYEPGYSGLSTRVSASRGEIDLGSPLADWNIDRWRLSP